MSIEGSMGAKLKIMVAAALTAVTHLQDVDTLTLRKTLVAATGHDAAGGYDEWYDSGKRTIPALKITLAWDDTDATHQALIAAFNSTSPVDMTLEDPNGSEVIAFKAHVQELGRVYKQNDVYKAQLTIQPTGQPTIS